MSQSNPKPKGRCVYCGKLYTGGGMSRHLASHLAKLPSAKGKQALHLKVNDRYGPYFLHLLMDGKAPLERLDDFLRAIWLECCGHLSQFAYGRWEEELPMHLPAGRLFEPGSGLHYAYDFGSTTELVIKCLHIYPIELPADQDVYLLSRNEPLQRPCDHCRQQPAEWICSVHVSDEEMHFCGACSETHQAECPDAEYALLPVVNSPRMGVCAYDGGMIDVERDQVGE